MWHAGLLEKLCAKDIQGHLSMLMGDHLHDRSLHIVINGQQSRNLPVGASVLQGSMLGSVLWNLYIDELLRTLLAVSAYADDCTLSRSYSRQDSQRAVADVNQQLQAIKRLGECCQVSYASEKTQAMVVSQSPAASQAVEGKVKLGSVTLPLQDPDFLLPRPSPLFP